MTNALEQDARLFRTSLYGAGVLIVLLWAVFLSAILIPWDMGLLGIAPRNIAGLTGIAGWGIAHGSWEHLLANTAGLFPLTAALLYLYRPIALRVIALVWLVGGAWVWAFAHGGRHIGASGVIYGLVTFLLLSGLLRKDRRAAILAIMVALFYGGLVWGVLPHDPGVSWEGHLYGALAGILAAFWFRKKGLAPPKPYEWEVYDDDPHNEGAWNYRKQLADDSPGAPLP